MLVKAPAESSRQVVSEPGTACPAAHGYMGTLAQPHGLSSGWLVAAVPLLVPMSGQPKPAPLHPTGIYSCRDRWTGSNKKHSGLINSHWHIRTLNTVRKVAPGGMFSKNPPLKGWAPHHVLVSPLEAHKAAAQLGFPLYEMQ